MRTLIRLEVRPGLTERHDIPPNRGDREMDMQCGGFGEAAQEACPKVASFKTIDICIYSFNFNPSVSQKTVPSDNARGNDLKLELRLKVYIWCL